MARDIVDIADKRRRRLLLGSIALAFAPALGTASERRVSEVPASKVSRSARMEGSISVLDFIPKAEMQAIVAGSSRYDATGAFLAAMQAGPRVYVPSGTYLVDSLRLRSNLEMFGDGNTSVIRPKSASAAAAIACNSGSPDIKVNIRGIHLRDIKLKGWVDTAGFAEHHHLMAVSGISEMALERVSFEGWSGDALYLGSGKAGEERHNASVSVVDCRFDGLNNDNRNAISAIDVDGLRIEDCEFINCTRHNMPGPIDLEPNDHKWHVVRNVLIRGNSFRHCGGMSGHVSCYQPPTVRNVPNHITIDGNRFEGYVGSGADVTFWVRKKISMADGATDLKVLNNKGSRGFRPFRIYNGIGTLVANNTFEDYAANAQIGYLGASDRVQSVLIKDNQFVRCGQSAAGRYGLSVFNADYLTIDRNTFIDCGDGERGSYAIQLNKGRSSHVEITNNVIESPALKTRTALVVEHAHFTDAKTNRVSGNRVGRAIALATGKAFCLDQVEICGE